MGGFCYGCDGGGGFVSICAFKLSCTFFLFVEKRLTF